MIGKSAGLLALLVFLFCGALYIGYQAESNISRLALTAAGEAGVTPAATPSVTSPVINIDGDAQCPVPKANQGYKAQYPYNAQYKDGTITKTNLYDKDCTEVQSKLNIKGKCRAAGECCAKEYQDFSKGWHKVLVDCKVGAGTGGTASAPGDTATPGATPVVAPKPAEVKPSTVTAPPGPGSPLAGYKEPAAPAGQPAVQPGNPAYAKIQEAAGGGAGPGQPGQTTFPGQTQAQTPTQPAGPAFEQGAVYRPGSTNPSGGLPGSTRPGYFSPSRAQNTFGGTGFSGSRSSGSVAGSFISGVASLIGGLFSVPTTNVVNYIQSFVGGPSQQQQTPANQNGGQQQTQAPGQVIVVVPYPMPTSRNTLGTQLPPQPTSTSDAYAELRELARQAGDATGTAVPTGTQEDRITSAFTGQEAETRPGTVPAGNGNGVSGATPAGRQGGVSLGGALMGTTSSPGRATSTHATSTSYKEPRVVEVGIPVDITDLGSYEAVLAYLRGDWARTEGTALQNKIALAQAEVQQEAIKAQLEALQDARAANLCDDSCAASLTVLQNELPVLQSRVEALQTAVEKDAQPRPSSPPPTVAQINRVVESLAEPTYEAAIPRSAASEPTAVSVAEQEAMPEVPQSKSEAIVTRVVQNIWNFLKSIFLPPATEAAKPRPSCSLFASLFGKCK